MNAYFYNQQKNIFLILIFCFFPCSAQEYVYPLVALEHSDGGCMMYVMHQKSPIQTELLLWNPDTHETFRGLSSSFSPASFTLLPQKNGFSFIDEGRIRIKYFAKRSPKAIDLHKPLSNLTVIHWVDDEHFYLSAQLGARFGIFLVSTRGEIETILADTDYDYLYPHKIRDQLFCFRRSKNREYSLIVAQFPVVPTKSRVLDDQQELQEQMRQLIFGEQIHEQMRAKSISEHTELLQMQAQVLFLFMTSTTEGFYLEYPREQSQDAQEITFVYNRVFCQDGQWKNEELFSFVVLRSLVEPGSSQGLYESMLPFVPKHSDGKIYFSGYNEKTHSISLFAYEGQTQKKTVLAAQEGNEYFGVCRVGQRLFYGGKIIETAHEKSFFARENGKIRLDLPEVHF